MIDVFETDSSTRRSTRVSAAATSSTARWRSSIRPWSETAKSTRSPLPPPRSTSWLARTRRSSRHARSAKAKASSAPPPAPIAIQPAVPLERLTLLRTEAENDRVRSGVVREGLLGRHRADLHLDLRRRRERRLLGDVEGDRLGRPDVDEADVPALDDRCRPVPGLLLDRQGERHLHLLRLARVLDRHLEAEVRRGRDRRLARLREQLAAREHLRRDEADAVDAGRCRRGRRRRAVDALPDRDHRTRAREVGVAEDLRVGDRDAGDALSLELLERRVAEVDVPVHVARHEELCLLGEQLPRLAGVLRLRGLSEGIREPRDAARPELERLDQVLVLDAERTRWVDRLRPDGELRLLLREPVQLRLEVGLLDPRRRQRVVQLAPHPGRAGGDRPHVAHVVRVLAVLDRAAAALDDEDEDDDEEDREGDEAGQAEEPCRLGGRPNRAARRARTARAPGTAAVARGAPTLRGLLGLRLVEEVELDVGVALGHRAWCRGGAGQLYRDGRRGKELDLLRPNRQVRWLRLHPRSPKAGSSSTATGRCGRSGAVARAPSGSPATSRPGSTSP